MVRELVAVARWMFSEIVMIGIAVWTIAWFADAWFSRSTCGPH